MTEKQLSEEGFRVAWCPRFGCTRFSMGYFTKEDGEAALERHLITDCDAITEDARRDAYERRTRIEGRWLRVARRWGLDCAFAEEEAPNGR